MNLSCVIVDDEYLAIKVLENYTKSIDNLLVESTFTRPKEALAFLQSTSIDILFLDVQMPGIDGFELLSQLDISPLVIFTTARPDYAVKAFDLNVLDYLVKPISQERFEKAVTKAEEYYNYRKLAEINNEVELDYLMIKADYRIHKIPFHDILYIEGMEEYLKIHTEKKTYIPLFSMKKVETLLPASFFLRAHKSFIVNKKHIVAYNHQQVILNNEVVIPIGRSYKNDFISKFDIKKHKDI